MSEQEFERWALTTYAANSPARVQVAGRQLAIAAQLKQDIERGRLVAILNRISVENAVTFLSEKQAIDDDLIERYEAKWNWERLSSNKALPWSLEFFERYEARWDWDTLSWNEALPWSFELIERYEAKWHWDTLSGNEALPWSLEFIDRYEARWDWEDISMNEALPWSLELIERYEDRWDWRRLSKNEALPWSLDLIDRFDDRWDWKFISANEALHLPLLRPADIVEIMAHHGLDDKFGLTSQSMADQTSDAGYASHSCGLDMEDPPFQPLEEWLQTMMDSWEAANLTLPTPQKKSPRA